MKKKKRRQICVFLVSSCCNLDYYDDVFIDNLGSIFNDHNVNNKISIQIKIKLSKKI